MTIMDLDTNKFHNLTMVLSFAIGVFGIILVNGLVGFFKQEQNKITFSLAFPGTNVRIDVYGAIIPIIIAVIALIFYFRTELPKISLFFPLFSIFSVFLFDSNCCE